MASLGRQIFGMSKEQYINKYGSKVCSSNKVKLD